MKIPISAEVDFDQLECAIKCYHDMVGDKKFTKFSIKLFEVLLQMSLIWDDEQLEFVKAVEKRLKMLQ